MRYKDGVVEEPVDYRVDCAVGVSEPERERQNASFTRVQIEIHSQRDHIVRQPTGDEHHDDRNEKFYDRSTTTTDGVAVRTCRRHLKQSGGHRVATTDDWMMMMMMSNGDRAAVVVATDCGATVARDRVSGHQKATAGSARYSQDLMILVRVTVRNRNKLHLWLLRPGDEYPATSKAAAAAFFLPLSLVLLLLLSGRPVREGT